MKSFSGRLLSFFLFIFVIFPCSTNAQKRRIIRLLTGLSKKASNDGQILFQNIANHEMQDIDTIYQQLFHWAKNEGPNFVKTFVEMMKKVEKEAYEKREELGIEIDQLPSFVIDAIQIVDLFRQDPTRNNLEEKKMIMDLKKTIEPLFVNRYQIMLDRAQKLQDQYGINLFRSPFAKRRKAYFQNDEL